MAARRLRCGLRARRHIHAVSIQRAEPDPSTHLVDAEHAAVDGVARRHKLSLGVAEVTVAPQEDVLGEGVQRSTLRRAVTFAC